MNLASIVLLLVILAIVVFITAHLWRNRGSGCSGCGRKDCPACKTGKPAKWRC